MRQNTNGTLDKPSKPNYLFDQLNTARQTWGRWFGDLYRAWWVILAAAVGAGLIAGFVWLLLAKWFTGFFVWVTITLVLCILVALDVWFFYKAGLVDITLPDTISSQLAKIADATSGVTGTVTSVLEQPFGDGSSGGSQTAYKTLAIVFAVVCVVALGMVIALRKAIAIAIAVIKLGADAMRHNIGVVFFPATTVAALLAFIAWWIFVAAALATSGTISTSDVATDVAGGVKALQNELGSSFVMPKALDYATVNDTLHEIKDMPLNNYLLIYHGFGLLWVCNFILGVAAMTIAGVIGGWYFSLNESNNPDVEPLRNKPPRFQTCAALWRTLRFHLGGVAFGSLLIALIQFIRAILAYFQRQMAGKAGEKSRMIRMFLCCLQCCLKCVQSCIEMVTRNAYIFIAVKGYSFCQAGRQVFRLIINNAATLATVNVLGEIIMFLGKLFITAGCGWVAYAILDNMPEFQSDGSNPINSSWLVILVTCIFAYFVASAFMVTFDLSVDTVLVCYVTDMEETMSRHGGDSAFKVPSHVKKTKLSYGAKAEAAKKATSAITDAENAQAAEAAAGASVSGASGEFGVSNPAARQPSSRTSAKVAQSPQ